MKPQRVLALLVALFALAGCSSGTPKTAPAPATAPTTVVGPLVGTFPVGQKATLPDGDTVQVYAYSANVTPSNQFSKPRPGAAFATVDAEACSGPSPTPGGLLNPFFFHLEVPGSETIPAGIPVKDPALNVAGLAPGACSRGFVTFEVPTDKTPSTVVYGIPAGSVRWSIP
ncbi:MAG TPA: hypothetical protein VL337_00705 [Acidimicrobiales bacterium]|nr:hypothetical protein [Acidimicrobiales bacterium]